MEYQIHNMFSISDLDPDKPYVIIGIVGPDDIHPEYIENDKCIGVLRLNFYDSEYDDGITTEQAKSVVKFIKKQLFRDTKPELIAVHCIVGVSRSAAVAAAIMKCLKDDYLSVFENPRYSPNDRVYKYIVDAWNKA